MKALIDINVILDLFLQRMPFVTTASALWVANEQGRFEAFISGVTPINAFYFVRKQHSRAVAREAVRSLVSSVRICAVDEHALRMAQILGITDYEDAVQHACATANAIDAIVTRNLGDYRLATLPVFAPADFLAQLPA